MATTRFDALTLRHPASWRAYLEPSGGDLPDGDAAYLTNEPINPRCTVTSGEAVSDVRCPLRATDVDQLGPGGVWIEVAMYYQPFTERAPDDLDLDGYRAQIQTGAAASGSCVGGRGGGHAVEVTATPWTDALQPSLLYISACFGPNTGPARHAFRALLHTATISSRPSESVPIADAAPCTHRDLHLVQISGQGINSAMSILAFQVTDLGPGLCRIGGFPRLTFLTADHRVVPFGYRDDRQPGRRAPDVFLRPRDRAYFQLIVWTCQSGPHVVATTARINLPDIDRAFALTIGHGGLFYCGTPQWTDTIGIDPLTGD